MKTRILAVAVLGLMAFGGAAHAGCSGMSTQEDQRVETPPPPPPPSPST